MSLSQRDRNLIWHPFTQEKISDLPVAVKKGKGSYLVDENDNELLDLVSSWWVNLYGHAHPEISRAIHEQCLSLEHVIFAGFTHEPAVALCENLSSILPAELRKFFFSDNGSTAVEVALKMSYQFWKNKGLEKKLFLSFEGGYHGDTVGCMSVGRKSNYHEPFSPLCFDVKFLEYPDTWIGDGDVDEKERKALQMLAEHVDKYAENVAALIMEPLVQLAGRMKMCRPNFVKDVVRLTRDRGIFVIFDEVATGFGRTGTYFALEQAGVVPDFLCMSKGITGGFLPLAVTATTSRVYEGFLADKNDMAFLHGHSYTANPVGCAAANASFKILTAPATMDAIKNINRVHTEEILKLLSLCKHAKRGRIRGTIAAFEVSENVNMKYFRSACLSNKIILRPLDRTVYLLPPYCITMEDLKRAYAIILDVLNTFS